MDDFVPFLQIIHISDLHIVHPDFDRWAPQRMWSRTLRRALPMLPTVIAQIEEGTASHDPNALEDFEDFVVLFTHKSQTTTWLVVTGDLTTFGDPQSLSLALQYITRLKQRCQGTCVIYGNHDAWPRAFPLVSADLHVIQQVMLKTDGHFSISQPTGPLREAFPNHPGEVQLYTVDSVLYGRWDNSLALGSVRPGQLTQLASLINKNRSPGEARDFRILALHHPVEYPQPRPALGMVLKNDQDVALAIDKPPSGVHPLAHLLLSGHTHQTWPALGALPELAQTCKHEYLGPKQCQYIAGTLTQIDRTRQREWPNQCEVLRLSSSPTKPFQIKVQRLIAARPTGNDEGRGEPYREYRFIPQAGKDNTDQIPTDDWKKSEVMMFDL
jgi:predicted MPP superfamily phosphohydrolase